MTTLSEALTTGRGVERPFRCQVHDDHNASASVNVLKGVWVCYACGAKGIVDGDAAIPSADELLTLLKEEEPPRLYADAWLDLFDADHPSEYWEDRFGYQVARHFRCGTHPMTGMPTYPLRDSFGRVTGVVVRQENEQPKYKYPYGTRTSETFFGDLDHGKVVVLVEGAADVMALHQAGIPRQWTVRGCYGAGLHYPQALLIAEISPSVVIAAYDDDDAGRMATERAAYALQDIAPVVSHQWGTVGGKDPADVPVEARITGLVDTLKATPYASLTNT